MWVSKAMIGLGVVIGIYGLSECRARAQVVDQSAIACRPGVVDMYCPQAMWGTPLPRPGDWNYGTYPRGKTVMDQAMDIWTMDAISRPGGGDLTKSPFGRWINGQGFGAGDE
jgi:hypothetical protein